MKDTITTLVVNGLSCHSCQRIIQKKISQIVGVKEVEVELSGETVIKADRKITHQEVENVLDGTGYEVNSDNV